MNTIRRWTMRVRDDRGDVPGWVLITLVSVVWCHLKPRGLMGAGSTLSA